MIRLLALVCVCLSLAVPAFAQDCQGHVCKASVTLTDAQIKALPTSAVEIVAAPGAGQMLVPIRAVLSFRWTANYTNIASTAAIGVTHANGYGMLTSLFQQPSSQIGNLLANDENALAILAPLMEIDFTGQKPYGQQFWPGAFENLNLTIGGYNGFSGNFTGGDAANTLLVTVYYLVVDL